MNILVAKIIIQDWIEENQIALFCDDQDGNFNELYHLADNTNNKEILECLDVVAALNMKHIMASK